MALSTAWVPGSTWHAVDVNDLTYLLYNHSSEHNASYAPFTGSTVYIHGTSTDLTSGTSTSYYPFSTDVFSPTSHLHTGIYIPVVGSSIYLVGTSTQYVPGTSTGFVPGASSQYVAGTSTQFTLWGSSTNYAPITGSTIYAPITGSTAYVPGASSQYVAGTSTQFTLWGSSTNYAPITGSTIYVPGASSQYVAGTSTQFAPYVHAIDSTLYHSTQTDVALFNVSTLQHGFMPKLTGFSSKYFTDAGTMLEISSAVYSTQGHTHALATTAAAGFVLAYLSATSQFLGSTGGWADPPAGVGGGTTTHALDSTAIHTMSDIAIFNVSTLMHGFVPKGDVTSTKFLSCTGGWQALTTDDFNNMSSAGGGLAPIGTTFSTQFLTSTGGWAALSTANINNMTSAAGGLITGATYSTRFLSSTGGFAALTSLTMNVMSSVAGGIIVGATYSTQFLTSTGGWSVVDPAIYYRYTTGTGTTFFIAAGPQVATVTNTSRAQPLISVQVPPWIQPSKVDVSIATWACSSAAAANIAWIICMDGYPPSSFGGMEFPITGAAVRMNPGILWAFPCCSSGYATYTTQMRISGGQNLTIAALTTSLVLLQYSSFKITGTTAAILAPSSIWSTTLLSTSP
jgi:hypothetical protein